jgi:hypothetical protein
MRRSDWQGIAMIRLEGLPAKSSRIKKARPGVLFCLENGMKTKEHNQYISSPASQFGPVQLPRSCGFQR